MRDIAGALGVLEASGVSASALETHDVLERAARAAASADRLVLFLTERDNVADLRVLLKTTEADVLLFAPTSPPHAALARVAREGGAALCSARDPLPVRQAALVAFVSSARSRAGP
jgi:hypothetical protein